MKNLRINIDEPRDAQKYVTRAEHDYNNKLDGVIESIITGEMPKVITLAGPTCSGKTTTAGKLTRRIREAGKNPIVLSIDDFFLNRTDRNVVTGEAPDYDTVKAIDLDLLEDFVRDLLRGNTVKIPTYDFEITQRTGYTEYMPGKDDVYIFEGIQAVYPEITSLFGDGYSSIFICVADDVKYRGSVIGKNDIRLCRRIVRDNNFRNATAEFSLHLWTSVRKNEEENIFPNAGGSKYFIDSFLRYEPFYLARYARPLLETVPKDSRYRTVAEELCEKLAAFEIPFFTDAMIPDKSMFREFIGDNK